MRSFLALTTSGGSGRLLSDIASLLQSDFEIVYLVSKFRQQIHDEFILRNTRESLSLHPAGPDLGETSVVHGETATACRAKAGTSDGGATVSAATKAATIAMGTVAANRHLMTSSSINLRRLMAATVRGRLG